MWYKMNIDGEPTGESMSDERMSVRLDTDLMVYAVEGMAGMVNEDRIETDGIAWPDGWWIHDESFPHTVEEIRSYRQAVS
jgi:hypothetical protein